MTRVVLQNAHVLDGSGDPGSVADIVIQDREIIDVGSDLDADVAVDYAGRWAIPGVIDCHVHVMVESFDLMNIVNTPFSLSFFIAARNLQKSLNAGVTYVRDAGGADLGVKKAVEERLILGPSMQISVNLLSMTGGHADHWSGCGYATPDLLEHPGRPDGVCDGSEEILRRTRQMIRAGADFIKVCTSGGVLSPTDQPCDAQFLPEEIAMVVASAQLSNRPVAAHAMGPAGIKNAVRAGVRSIEHGSILDDEAIDLMLENGTYLVPTMMALDWLVNNPDGRRPDELEKAHELSGVHKESIRRAIDAGVRIAMGTDAGVGPHGQNLRELGLLVDAGMTPLEAIRSATVTGAELLGISETHGTIAPGKRADIVMLARDPVSQIRQLSDNGAVAAVWKDGRLVAPRQPSMDVAEVAILDSVSHV